MQPKLIVKSDRLSPADSFLSEKVTYAQNAPLQSIGFMGFSFFSSVGTRRKDDVMALLVRSRNYGREKGMRRSEDNV